MKKDSLYTTTEWEWLSLQVRLYSIESRGTLWSVHFYLKGIGEDLVFQGKNAEIICRIYNQAVEELFSDPQEELEATFIGWVEWQKRKLGEYLSRLPVLQKEFDLE